MLRTLAHVHSVETQGCLLESSVKEPVTEEQGANDCCAIRDLASACERDTKLVDGPHQNCDNSKFRNSQECPMQDSSKRALRHVSDLACERALSKEAFVFFAHPCCGNGGNIAQRCQLCIKSDKCELEPRPNKNLCASSRTHSQMHIII